MKDKDGRQIPDELASALQNDSEALLAWNKMTRSHQRDYTRWIGDSEKEDLRSERVELSMEMLKVWRQERGYG